jgi:uncharacterized protein (TIGR03435 family)
VGFSRFDERWSCRYFCIGDPFHGGSVIRPDAGGRGESGRAVDASDPSSSSIFVSVQQLGLKLEPRKAPFEFVVIDHVERMPSEN